MAPTAAVGVTAALVYQGQSYTLTTTATLTTRSSEATDEYICSDIWSKFGLAVGESKTVVPGVRNVATPVECKAAFMALTAGVETTYTASESSPAGVSIASGQFLSQTGLGQTQQFSTTPPATF